MTIQYFYSPFHVTHDGEVASIIAGEMELSILADCIKKPDVKESKSTTLLVGHPNYQNYARPIIIAQP
ncbi:hypothetical protein ABH906_001885 [Pseudomonas frederiksbergensis]